MSVPGPLVDASTWVRGSGLEIVLLVLGAALLTRGAARVRDGVVAGIDARDDSTDALVRSEAAKHHHAVVQVLAWVVLVAVYCVTGVLVLARFGVPLSGLVAPATVAGVALGLGAQRVVQDLVAGFFIITERQYGFGDLVRISSTGVITDALGTVEDVTLRVTRLRSVDGEVVVVPNGQIARATNLSRDWARAVVDVPLPATADVGRASEILQQVGAAAWADPELSTQLLDGPTTMGGGAPGGRRAAHPARRAVPARPAVRRRACAPAARRGGVRPRGHHPAPQPAHGASGPVRWAGCGCRRGCSGACSPRRSCSTSPCAPSPVRAPPAPPPPPRGHLFPR